MSKKISINGKVALVTGANRGIGKAIAVEFLESGAKKVYAAARSVETLASLKEIYGDKLVPIEIDVTKDDTIAKAAEVANDVEILVNNAGIFAPGMFKTKNIVEGLTANLEVNLFGVAKVTTAFLDIIQSKEAGAILNVSSVAGLGNFPSGNTYSVSKAAVHSLTQGLRAELADSNILVSGVYPGPIDTDMTKGMETPKGSPEDLAKDVVKGMEEGTEDIFPDPMAKQVGEGYSKSPKAIEKQFASWM